MHLPHATALAEARSHLAALADRARTFEAALEYDRVLLRLDTIHGDDTPATHDVAITDLNALFDVAETAIEALTGFGVDPLTVELLLASLEDARDLDTP